MVAQQLIEARRERQRRFAQAASRVVPKPNLTKIIPNTPYGVPKVQPGPTPIYRPPYETMWFYNLVHQISPKFSDKTTIRDCIIATAKHFKIDVRAILSQRRTAVVVRPRQIAMFIAKRQTLHSLPEIGRRFGGRDHTTVMHAVRKMETLSERDPQLANDIAAIEREVMR